MRKLKGWSLGRTFVGGADGAFISECPLRLWRVANDMSAVRLGTLIKRDPSCVMMWELGRGIPPYYLREVETILESDFERAQDEWRTKMPRTSRYEKFLTMRFWGPRRNPNPDVHIRQMLKTIRNQSDRFVAAQWLREHRDDLKSLDPVYHRAIDNALRFEFPSRMSSHVDRLMFSSMRQGERFYSIEDYVIDKIDAQRKG